MLSTALSVQGSRRIGMAARRSSTWVVRGRICFIRRRISGIIEVDEYGDYLGVLRARTKEDGYFEAVILAAGVSEDINSTRW